MQLVIKNGAKLKLLLAAGGLIFAVGGAWATSMWRIGNVENMVRANASETRRAIEKVADEQVRQREDIGFIRGFLERTRKPEPVWP